jgi:hypothetical protein
MVSTGKGSIHRRCARVTTVLQLTGALAVDGLVPLRAGRVQLPAALGSIGVVSRALLAARSARAAALGVPIDLFPGPDAARVLVLDDELLEGLLWYQFEQNGVDLVGDRHDQIEDRVAELLLVFVLERAPVEHRVVHVLLVGQWVHEEKLEGHLL